MAIRTDIHVDFSVSPRLVLVEDPSDQVTMQDLHDTLRNIEARPQNSDDDELVSTAGKEDLGGGVKVGLTTTLMNAKLAFWPRQPSIATSTATTLDASGIYLIDATASFVSSGVVAGANVINLTDTSVTLVIQVVNETTLRCFPLRDGSDNQWEIGDAYKVWNVAQCEATGGNIVAVDSGGVTMSALLPTLNTQIVRTSSASATIAELEIENIQRIIETQRPSHMALGDIYYWDPVMGNDGYAGTSPDRPVKTFARAHALAGDYHHDLIICQPGQIGSATVTTEKINITKSNLMVRGPGVDFKIMPSGGAGDTVTISGTGCELSGVLLGSSPIPGCNGVVVQGDNTLLSYLTIQNTTGCGVCITTSRYSVFDDCVIANCAGHGINVQANVTNLDVKNCQVIDMGGDGIHIAGAGISEIKIRGKGTASYDNAGYGLYIGTLVDRTMIDTDATIYGNALGGIEDNGQRTVYSGIDHSAAFQGYVWLDTSSSVTGTNYPRGTPAFPVNNLIDARAIAQLEGLKRIRLIGNITLDQTYSGWQFHGASSVGRDTININGHDITASYFNRVTVTGVMTGTAMNMQECIVANLIGADGIIVDSGIAGTITMTNPGASLFTSRCNGIGKPIVIDLGGINRTFRGALDGDLEIRNSAVGCVTSIGSNYGTCHVASSCTDGTIYIRGVTYVTDESGAGCTVVRDGQVSDSPQAYRDAIHIDTMGHGTAGTLYPTGTASQPVDNLVDARTIADTLGIHKFVIHGAVVLDQHYEGYQFAGCSSVTNDVIVLNGFSVNKSYFDRIALTGTGIGSINAQQCVLNNVSGLSGIVMGSALSGTLTLDTAPFLIGDSYAMDSPTVIDMVGAGRIFRGRIDGDVELRNMDVGSYVSIGSVYGSVTITPSCVGGEVFVLGNSEVTDNSSPGCTVQCKAVPCTIWDETLIKHNAIGTYGAELATKADINAAASTDYVTAASGSIIEGTNVSGSYVSTHVRDGVYWEIGEDAVTGMTVEMSFNLPSAQHRPGTFSVFGYYAGVPATTHYLELWAYNYVATAWEQIEEVFMPGGHTSEAEHQHEVYERHIDRAHGDEVKIRLIHNVTTYNPAHRLYLDLVQVSGIRVVTAADIADAVWDEDLTAHTIPDSSAAKLVKIGKTVAPLPGLL